MSVAVISSIFGGYDQPLAPVAQDMPCDWVMVTDQPLQCEPWKVVVEPRPQLHPRLAAKVAKANPEQYSDADVLIWVDGNLRIESPDFVRWCVDSLGDEDLAQHHSVERASLLAEASVASGMPKYDGLPVWEQARHYIADGHPVDWGVWWTGLMVRAADCPAFGDAWLAEMVRWTYEDQISEPYVLLRAGLRPADIPIDWQGNKRFSLLGHRDHR
jgi:hypothetical protein